MKEKSKYKIYIDSSDRNSTKLVLSKIEETKEIEIEKKEGQFDIVFFIKDMLNNQGISIGDVEIIEYNKGPGSFTGLRIGATISNVLNWIMGRKNHSELEYPNYGSEPHITPPKKFKLE